MLATVINRLSLLFVIGGLLTVMTGSVSAATHTAVSAPTFSYSDWDGGSCPYSAGYKSVATELSLPPAPQ